MQEQKTTTANEKKTKKPFASQRQKNFKAKKKDYEERKREYEFVFVVPIIRSET